MREKYFVSPILEEIRNSNLISSLDLARDISARYIKQVDHVSVFPNEEAIRNLCVFDEALANEPEKIEDILNKLEKYGSPATLAQTGGRYFGFVNGGILPSALCSKWITGTWDQNAALYVTSPITSKIEEVCEEWLKELLGLPKDTVAGYVSGSSTATMIGLIAGRNYLINNMGYDISKQGLFNAPEIKVVLGEETHSTVYKALSIIGLGNDRIIKVPCDNEGRMIVEYLPELDDKTLIILQAGNVNSGAFDDFNRICKKANEAGAWIHIDGAFGLWVAASEKMTYLTKGFELADSWSLDAHKTLNAPYDNGIILCKHKDILVNSMHMTGSYIIYNENRDGMLYTMDMSRRARALELWATLKSLGRNGVSELVEELHHKALYFAELLREGGCEILNEIVFNQVLVYFEDDAKTEALIKSVQESGVCWLGGSKWLRKSVMRISVCSYKTSYRDIEISAHDILRIAHKMKRSEM